ncbi:MAG: hypothetical protein ACFFCZ_11105 [Promethearchaeota archaeon]
MMRSFSGRLEAWWLAVLLPLGIGIIFFPAAYPSLFNWLSPLTGPWLYPFLLYLYILVANPLQWWIIAVLWIITGLIAGLIAGTVRRSIPVFFLAIGTNLALLVISFIFLMLDVTHNFSGINLTEALSWLVAIMPPGLINELFVMPILGELLTPIIIVVSTAISRGTPLNQEIIQNMIFNSLGSLALGLSLNILLFLVALLFGGYLRQFTPFSIETSDSDYRIWP